ncbi:MAG: hypothetical protein ABJL17_04180 [Parvibaculum sp.]|uniref:hypothetical protein n=1 Tax=Parvibaculum sp. TaxID=2024848 RepID=UPI003267F7A7
MFFHGLIRQERERIMKRSINVIFGGMLAALVSVSAAWAGSAASVNQTGDDGVTLVVQRDGKPARVETAINPAQQFMLKKKARAAVKQASRPRSARGGKFGSRAARCNPLGGSGSAFVGQNGVGNSAAVTQKGAHNVAGIIQDGNGNKSHIVQKGKGHFAETIQAGNNNSAYVIQRC